METSSLAASRRAAQHHVRSVAAGPPRSARRTAPAAGLSAVGAAVALPVLRPAAVALVALTVLLLAVHRSDRRNAWRYVPEPVVPARVLPPLRRAAQTAVIDLAALEEPVPSGVGVPTQAVPVLVPRPRVAVDGLVELPRTPDLAAPGPGLRP